MLAGFKTTGGAAVAGQGLHRMFQSALDLWVEFFMFQLLCRQPFGRRDQGALLVQMLHVPRTRGRLGGVVGGFHGHNAFQNIQAGRLLVVRY